MANPPLIGTDVDNSAPGVVQPQILGGESLPPSFPLGTAGTWLPPPTVGNPVGVPTFPPTGTDTAPVPIPSTTPFPTPVVPPGTGIDGPEQPVIADGPSLPPAFPLYTSPGPVQPIVLTSIVNTSLPTSVVPTTPGTQPILVSEVETIPQLPWNPGGDEPEIIEPPPDESPPDDEETEPAASPYTGIHQQLAESMAEARGIRKPRSPSKKSRKR